MKFWQKIFIWCFLIMLVFFDVIGIRWIYSSFASIRQDEISAAISKNQSLNKSLQTTLTYWEKALYDRDDLYNTYTSSVIAGILTTENNGKALVEDADGVRLYSDVGDAFGKEITHKLGRVKSGINYSVINFGGSTFIVAASRITTDSGKHTAQLYSISDIGRVCEDQSRKTKESILFGSVICMLAAAIMALISYYLTRPLSKLKNTAKLIADGDYSHRSTIKANNEIGELSDQINVMAVAVEKREAELRDSIEQRQRFVSSITHEMKTPLTSIIAYADLIRAVELDTDEMDEDLRYISNEGKRLETLSRKLLSLYKIKPGNIKRVNLKLGRLFEDMEEIVKPIFAEKQLRLDIEKTTLAVYGDEELLKSMLYNLLSNAAKASAKGQSVSLSATDTDEGVTVFVKDSGCGIESSALSHMMEPFFMVNKKYSAYQSGSGLGLSVCKAIADAHQANITITSEENVGTTIAVAFGRGISADEKKL